MDHARGRVPAGPVLLLHHLHLLRALRSRRGGHLQRRHLPTAARGGPALVRFACSDARTPHPGNPMTASDPAPVAPSAALGALQQEIDAWIQAHGGYWPPLANLARLTEEVGEPPAGSTRPPGLPATCEDPADIAGEMADVKDPPVPGQPARRRSRGGLEQTMAKVRRRGDAPKVDPRQRPTSRPRAPAAGAPSRPGAPHGPRPSLPRRPPPQRSRRRRHRAALRLPRPGRGAAILADNPAASSPSPAPTPPSPTMWTTTGPGSTPRPGPTSTR